MDEYIRRGAAIEQFEDSTSAIPEKLARIRIKEIPAAEVVAPVRCRECRFAPEGENDGLELEWPERYSNPCPFKCEDAWYSQKPGPDFFCACGKRKDGGQHE